MYGPIGPSGPVGAYASGSVSGEYGFLPLIAIAGVVGGLALAERTITEGGEAYVAQKDAEGYTGGKIRNAQTGEWENADVVHNRLCASLPDTHPYRVPDESGFSFCDRTPSQEASYWADAPEGAKEWLREGVGGYEYRKQKSGDCSILGADGRPLDPRCARESKSFLKPWMLFATAGVIAAGIFLIPNKPKA